MRQKLGATEPLDPVLAFYVERLLATRSPAEATVCAAAAPRTSALQSATETLGKALDEMVQLHGGYGYMPEYPIARDFVDMRVTRIYGGTSEVMRELIARNL